MLVEAIPYGFTLAICMDNFNRWSRLKCTVRFLIKLLIGRDFIVFLLSSFHSNHHSYMMKFILLQNECLCFVSLCPYYFNLISLSEDLMKKYTIKIYYITVFTDTDSAELPLHHCLGTYWCPLQTLCHDGHCCPLQVLCHYGHWNLLQVLCHDGHCCPMLTLYLVPWWSLLSIANLYLVTWQPPVYALQC